MTIFMDSFQYTTAEIPKKWNVLSQQGLAHTIQTSGGPYAGRFIRLIGYNSSGVNNESRLGKTIGQSDIFSVCLSWRKGFSQVEGTAWAICELFDGATSQLQLGCSAGEKVGIYRNGTLLAEIDHQIARDNWYHIRWKATISDSCPANSNQLQLVGPNVNATVTVPTSTATRVSTNNFASIFALSSRYVIAGTPNAVSRSLDYSDVYVSNEEAVLLPNLRVHALRPTGNGTTMQWTPNTGTAWEATDDLTPDDDTTKISTATDAHIALFTHAGLPTPAESVKAVQMAAWAKKDDAFDVNLEPTYRIAGTNYYVSESPVGNAYAAIHKATDEDPAATTAWTESVVNAMEIGVRVKHG
jgi:hypothetical protein